MTLPWEVGAGAMPWETDGFPRTVSIARITNSSTVGSLAYQGMTEAAETTIATGIPASIELTASGRNSSSGTDIPADSAGPLKFGIYIPSYITLPAIQERDIVYDDLVSPAAPNGRRFQVSGYMPVPTGYRLDCVRLLT